MMEFRIRVNPRLLIGGLAALMALILLGSFIAQAIYRVWGHDHIMGLAPLLNVDAEANLPAWLSSATFLLCAVVAFALGTGAQPAPREGRKGWLLMTAVLILLSADEAAQLHEKAYSLSGRLGSSTPVVMVAAVVGAVLLFGRFVARMPSRTRNWIVVAFLVFATGAFGIELITRDLLYSGLAKGTLDYSLLSHAEEALEMTGLVVLLAALFHRVEILQLSADSSPRPSSASPG